MNALSDIDKNMILDYLSELLDKEKNVLKKEQVVEISEESRKIQSSRSTKKLFSFFEEKGYHIISLTEKQQIPREQSKLAGMLTKNRSILSPFIQAVLHEQEGAFDVSSASLETLMRLLNTCKSFSDRQWIEIEHCKKEKIIKFKRGTALKGEVMHFLSGIFGEYGTAKIIEKALQDFAKKQNGFKYKIFHDIKLKKPDSLKQNDMQLDLVVQLPEGFYIFETKMGQTLAVEKWVDRTRSFASGKNRFITCCADKNLHPKIFTPLILFNLDDLEKQMYELLQKDYSG